MIQSKLQITHRVVAAFKKVQQATYRKTPEALRAVSMIALL
jgi:hypothetical protein